MYRRFGRRCRRVKYYTDHACLSSLAVYPDTELFYQFAIIDPGPGGYQPMLSSDDDMHTQTSALTAKRPAIADSAQSGVSSQRELLDLARRYDARADRCDSGWR